MVDNLIILIMQTISEVSRYCIILLGGEGSGGHSACSVSCYVLFPSFRLRHFTLQSKTILSILSDDIFIPLKALAIYIPQVIIRCVTTRHPTLHFLLKSRALMSQVSFSSQSNPYSCLYFKSWPAVVIHWMLLSKPPSYERYTYPLCACVFHSIPIILQRNISHE